MYTKKVNDKLIEVSFTKDEVMKMLIAKLPQPFREISVTVFDYSDGSYMFKIKDETK